MRAAPLPSSRLRPAQVGDTAEALHAVRVLLEATTDPNGSGRIPDRLVGQARRFFRMSRAILLRASGVTDRVCVSAMDPPSDQRHLGLIPIGSLGPVAEALDGSGAAVCAVGAEAEELAAGLDLTEEVGTVLLLPIKGHNVVHAVLALVDPLAREFSEQQLDVAEAFAAAVGAGLARFQLARAQATESSRQVALSNASKSLNASLDINRVLVRICEESARILEADTAVVYMGDSHDGLCMEAGTGVGPEAIGLRLEPGDGLSGRVIQQDEPMLTNDYQSLTGTPSVYANLRSAMAVPLRWEGRLHGVLSLGWTRLHFLRREHLDLLTSFGDMAAAACRNATTHEGLMVSARTDALTGCLNQAALHETLRTELDRCRRTGQKLSLAIVDMDDFKQVNERHGHLVGDEVLRRVGRALRRTVRPYDMVGRYGGDEFAIVAVDTEEADACEVAARAIERVARSVKDLDFPVGGAGATAGVAEWDPGESATELIRRADRALLYGKHEGARGKALRASEVTVDFESTGPERASTLGFAAAGPQPALSESR